MKQPKRLTVSVPHGKNVLLGDFISVEMMYRIAPPMKLPMPTMNIDFSIWEDLFLLLFSDAEVCEDVAEDFVGGDFATCDFGKVEEGFADVLGYEVGWNIHL